MGSAHPALANGYATYAPPLMWSPDSRWLAAVVGDGLPQDGQTVIGELRVCDRYGRYAVVGDGCSSACFSPDSKWLAVVRDGDVWIYKVPEPPGATARGDAASQPADIQAPQAIGKITARGDVFDCRWGAGPGGDAVIYFTAGERFYGSAIFTLSWPSLAITRLLDNPPDGSAFAPVASPDGFNLLWLAQNGLTGQVGYERLMVYDQVWQASRLLTLPQQRPDDYHESNAAFLDPGTVLFQRGGWGDWNLHRLDLETGKETLELTDAELPSFSADGRHLAFVRRDYAAKKVAEYDWEVPTSVLLRDRQSGGEWQVSAPGVMACFPAIAPDGSTIAWIEASGEGQAVQIRARQAFQS